MSEKGFFHTVRRSTLGRSDVEHETHQKNFRELKSKINNSAQATIDNLNDRYQNSDVHEKIEKKHGPDAANKFVDELKALQVSIIEAKGEYLDEREHDEHNDIEDIGEETERWEHHLNKIVEESYFRELAESYEVWGHEPVKKIQTSTRGKVIDINRRAA